MFESSILGIFLNKCLLHRKIDENLEEKQKHLIVFKNR